jgi:hypothetical protein
MMRAREFVVAVRNTDRATTLTFEGVPLEASL